MARRMSNTTTTMVTEASSFTVPVTYPTDLVKNTIHTNGTQASDEPYEIPAPWVWLPMEWTWWVILQLLFAILGILGNLLVIMVLFQRRHVRRSTDTLIGALAFADFLTSVFLIPHPAIDTLPSNTWLAQVYCRIIHPSLIMWISVVASVFTLIAISLERYLAIAHPFFFMRNVKSARISICIVIIWAAAVATNSFQFVIGFAAEDTCVVMFPSQNSRYVIALFVFIIEFVLPVIMMVSAQAMTAVILHRQSLKFQKGNSQEDRSNANMNHIIARKRVIQMLCLVTTIFIVCWGPDQIFFLLLNLGVLDISFLFSPLHRSVVVLAFVNSCANVFIYTIRYPQFREAMWDMFRRDSKSTAPLFGGDISKYQGKSVMSVSNV